MKKTVIVTTGAGCSADSGIKTFRDYDGLWENYRIEDVATPYAFEKNPQLVWNFYKQRHDQLYTIQPNEAHHAIARLQKRVEDLGFEFVLLTQNVDRLHSVAGSNNVHELHGNLYDVKCSSCTFIDGSRKYWENADIPKCPECGSLLRPNIVWFGEMPDQDAYYAVDDKLNDCAILLVVGSSCQVQPASGLVYQAVRLGAQTYECNMDQSIFFRYDTDYKFVKGRAAVTVPEVCNTIVNKIVSIKHQD